MSQYPPLPVFDENDEQIGEAALQEILNKGLIHRIVHVIVEDEVSKVLLQKRGSKVATNAGKWDFSAAGYVDLGEDYDDAAKRELEEELNLKNKGIIKLSVERNSETHKEFTTNRFVATYKVVVSPGTTIKFDPNEVAKVQWFDQTALKKLIETDTNRVTPYTAEWLKKHYLSDEDN